MTQERIARINALAAKAKTAEGLTAAELAERDALRKEYLADIRANVRAQLDNAQVQEADGSVHPLKSTEK